MHCLREKIQPSLSVSEYHKGCVTAIVKMHCLREEIQLSLSVPEYHENCVTA